MCNCSKISTCGGNWTFSTCVKYEGSLPETSQYYNECDVSVQDTIEELYTLVGNGGSSQGIEYFNGDGLALINRVFSAKFGVTPGTILEGSWRPTWDEVLNKPEIPEQVNLIAGDNITINGVYPNLTINAESVGQENLIERISLGNTQASIIDKTAFIPIATTVTPGLVKVGTGLNIATDGTLSSVVNTYTAGNGLTLTGNQFSLPITTSGTGTFVQSIVQTSNGLTVTLGTPSGTSPQAGTFLEIEQGTSANTRVWSPLILNQWFDNERIVIEVPGAPNVIKQGTVRFISGSNMTITQSGTDIFFNATGGGGTYTAGSGLTLTANQFSLPVSYVGSGNYVTNVTQNTNGLTVTLGTLPAGQVYTAGSGITLTSNQFSVPVTTSGSGNVVTDVVQTANGIDVQKSNFSPTLTVIDEGIVGGQTVNPTAMLTRLVVNSSTTFTVLDGNIEGQQIVIVPCTFTGDMTFNIKVIKACSVGIDTSDVINFTAGNTSERYSYWWSTNDGAWLALQ